MPTDKALQRQERALAREVNRIFANPRSTFSAKQGVIRKYLSSFAARVVAADEAVADARRRDRRRSIPSAREIAASMNVWEPCDEEVYVSAVAKANTEFEYRAVYGFGVHNCARQILVRNALKARWAVAPQQTLFDVGGAPEAIRRVSDYYARGYKHSAEVDIRHCYNSFDNVEEIARFFALPERVVKHVLTPATLLLMPSRYCMRHQLFLSSDTDREFALKLFYAHFLDGDEESARQGLTQGSKARPFVAEMLLAQLCNACSEEADQATIAYADNFFLMAPTAGGLAKLTAKLVEALTCHPAGSLKEKFPVRTNKPDEPFEFLGYRLIPDAGRLVATMSTKNEAKARRQRREAYRQLASEMPAKGKERLLRDLERKQLNTVNAFPAWPEGRAYHAEKMAKLRAVAGFPVDNPLRLLPTSRRRRMALASAAPLAEPASVRPRVRLRPVRLAAPGPETQ